MKGKSPIPEERRLNLKAFKRYKMV